MKKLSIFLIISMLFQSCSFDTAENYFDRTTLNTNKFRDFGNRKFKNMIAQRNGGMLYTINNENLIKTESLQENVTGYLLVDIEKDIKKIEALKITDDTKALIEASLKEFNFVKNKYETDYLEIAKMIDEGVDTDKINETLLRFDEKNIPELDALHQELMDIAMSYAKKNGIKAQTY
ncbi:hypothetical protein [Costertonia aggregata]|uniref:DUF4142 domain-containing protein n=1 Tax=Costertonia aggregata TaxID=343403 RepID=A0A7H9AQT2_9FLAO|nr:hypothetical protein [Costertonia aggregata]QLG45759.1 hypothetical protein HYG79_10500 [Costertonia aggregata]